MNLHQWMLAFVLFSAACNKSQPSPGEAVLSNPSLRDSLKDVQKEVAQRDSLTRGANKSPLDSLITAARDNDVALVKRLVGRGVDVNGKVFHARRYGVSPLSEAVRRNHFEVVSVLVENGADPNLQLGESPTPFHISAGGCSFDRRPCSDSIFALLLAKGGDVNAFHPYQSVSALITAIEAGDIAKARLLIRAGAVIDPDSENKFRSPLAAAVYTLQYDMVKLLLEHGADINATFTEAHEDCVRCPAKISIVHALVSMYDYADKQKVESLLDLVLDHKPDLNIESAYGLTALEFAAFGESIPLAEKLIRRGARLETQGSSAIHCAAQFSNLAMVTHLLKYKVNVNVQDPEGNTPLYLCLTCCGGGFGETITGAMRAETIELLLNHGADPKIKNPMGESFMHKSRHGTYYKEVNDLLVKRGLLEPQDIKTN